MRVRRGAVGPLHPRPRSPADAGPSSSGADPRLRRLLLLLLLEPAAAALSPPLGGHRAAEAGAPLSLGFPALTLFAPTAPTARGRAAARCTHREVDEPIQVSAEAAAEAAGRDAAAEESEPESMVAIARMLQEESIAPQWIETLEPSAPGVYRGGKLLANGTRALRPHTPRLPDLREQEVLKLADTPDPPLVHLSDEEQELLQVSLASIDYLGDWSSPMSKDSIVLCCEHPHVEEGVGGAEYTCSLCSFQADRQALHTRIIDQMLRSSRTSARGKPSTGRGPLARIVTPKPKEGELLPPQQQHIFLVVGVPGSGKDSVIKRYLRTLDIPLLDASADLVKEYLAAWGSDELSQRVRENNRLHGPGKHLLHAQYLHRESILLIDQVVERALEEGRSIMLEKTLHDNEHVLTHARKFRERGCKVHLIGTHITPLANWRFLCNRMASGAAFGRHISKAQAIASLRRYHRHFGEIIDERSKRTIFDSIHMFDVIRGEWCVRIPDTTVRFAEDGLDDEDAMTSEATP